MTSSKGFRGQTIVFTNSRKKCHSISQALRIQSAPYHAGLTYPQRKSVEERFEKGEIKVVVTTAALAAGVDFPASQVIFESLAMGKDWLGVGAFQQMQGRAGRPDYHDLGKIVRPVGSGGLHRGRDRRRGGVPPAGRQRGARQRRLRRAGADRGVPG